MIFFVICSKCCTEQWKA